MNLLRSLITISFVLTAVLSLGLSAQAQQIKEVKVIGQTKMESSAIKSKISHPEKGPLRRDLVRDDLQTLFDMGFFSDIQVSIENGVLTYKLEEKPIIARITFEGNSEIDDDELREKILMKAYELINYGKIQKAQSEILKAYEEKGYLLAQVTYELKPMPNKEEGVELRFNVSENDKVMVKKVTFMGNTKVSDGELKKFMMTQEGGYFSFVSGSGTYKQDLFEDDVKRLSLIYLNKGYVQAKVSRPEVSLTPDKKGIYIVIKITEGQRFKVGEVSFTGDIIYDVQELRELVTIDDQEYFSYETMQKDLRSLEAKYGDDGYAYTNPIPRTQILDQEETINITFEIDKGQKVYFRKINVVSNTSTRDKVVRRELRIGEGELYNESLRRESETNVRRLGFFEDVQFLTRTPPGREDQMDIDIVVKERNTGSFQLGAGYADSIGTQFNIQLNETNFLGYGYRTGLRLEYNENFQNYLINFTDPYFRDSLWTVGGSVHWRNTGSLLTDFRQESKGFTTTVGRPIYGRYLYGFTQYKISDDFVQFDSDFDYSDAVDLDSANGLTSSVTFSLEYDLRNDRMMPTDGLYARLSYEYAGLGGQVQFFKAQANFRFYHNVFWDVIFRNNFNYGILGSVGGNEVPFTELYRLGGPNNLRGYGFFDVGDRVFSPQIEAALTPSLGADEARRRAQVVVGGQQQAFYMGELEFPLAQEAGMRGVVFYDAGIASDELGSARLRANYGFGLRWFSPMGPLRFEFGFPLDRQAELGDASNNFQFAVGSPF